MSILLLDIILSYHMHHINNKIDSNLEYGEEKIRASLF